MVECQPVNEIVTRLSDVAERLLHVEGTPFSLKDYPMHYAIYNGRYKRTLLKCGRQVAKCLALTEPVLMADGSLRPAGEIRVGDQVVSMASDGVTLTTSKVTWVSERRKRTGVEVSTRQGRTASFATTHPLRTWDAWTPAGELEVGTRVAAVRRAGVFGQRQVNADRIAFTAFMIGDGHIGAQYMAFTALPGPVLTEFLAIAKRLGLEYRTYQPSRAVDVRWRRNARITKWFKDDGLYDTRSLTKFVPAWVFSLSRKATALFLNRLWSTDGSVKRRNAGSYAITYTSISKTLIDQVQALLWKFGVVTSVRAWDPRKGSRAYTLRVETQQSVRIFLTQIGALGKTEEVPLPSAESNNNRDTLPIGVNTLIRKLVGSSSDPQPRYGCTARASLRAAGLRETLKYPITAAKLAAYVQFFKDGAYEQEDIAALEKHATSDLIWDEVTALRRIPCLECVDFTIEGTHNFVANGLITHNSTTIANWIISESIAIPFFKTYYISPSREQTTLFSNTRVAKVLAYSNLVRDTFQSPEHADRVMHRSYTNGSENAFTYACDDADRVRGFSADRNAYDEFQDMLYEAVVPVANAAMKNSKYRFEIYAGTPKTMENSIEYLWSRSTRSEWVMKCDGCSKHTIVVDVKALGKHGPICLNCGHGLNPRKGIWVDMQAQVPGTVPLIKGFHIPSPIMPANIAACYTNPEDQARAQERWDDILRDMEEFSSARFRNEVLGVSDAQGTRLISLEELQALCQDYLASDTPSAELLEGITLKVGGVDWSGGGTTGVSRTVAWVFGWHAPSQKLKVLWYHIYPGTNPYDTVEHIVEMFNRFGVMHVFGDAGEGALPNSTLREKLGHHRVTQVQYGAFNKPFTWNGTDRYLADRTTMIDNYILMLKRQGITYPRFEQMKPAISDVLNVYEEVTTAGKKVWRHSPQLPDDCLHAQLFAWLAWKLVVSDLKFYS